MTATVKTAVNKAFQIEYPDNPPASGILPGKIIYNREPETERENKWVLQLEKAVIKKRKCLSCENIFKPSSKFNRICRDCSERNEAPGIRRYKFSLNIHEDFLTEEPL